MILPFDYIGYKRLSENKRFRNHRWYSNASWWEKGWMSSIKKNIVLIIIKVYSLSLGLRSFN